MAPGDDLHDLAGARADSAARMSSAPAPMCAWAWLGTVPYARALHLQEQLRTRVVEGDASDTLLLLEHEPVITLGRHANAANMLESPERLAGRGVAVVATSRGGDVTYHGPGQLVGYPVFRLRRGIRAHLSEVAQTIIAVLHELEIAATWDDARPGIWVGNDKICAVGVHVRRRVAIHGFALNVSVDLAEFQAIVPCGLPRSGVTSIAKLLGNAPSVASLAERVARACERSFGVRMIRLPATSSRLQTGSGDR